MSFSETTTSLKVRFLALMDEVGSVAEVARRLDVDRNTAYGWARQAGLSSHRLGHPWSL
ncbi:helix-turn-helix domain-containing protein [Rhodococcus pyridinivorans]|uniref:helix-turn-helix domain-containing protein n=1 Tax=Rhodococcus pyridinivorans TaxID=103816 RepID=UPI001D146825|nr:helix-turn-helix domain-containing protein [Rhodococcus pyridinivorans]WMM71561.1 helix-turn-helix domain-containing protein [Rhodococcus pyridinivorans]